MSEVVSRISEWLVAEGHDVTVATSYCAERADELINGVKVRSFAISGNMVTGIQGETQQYIEYLKETPFDIITNFAAQQWATDLCLDILPGLAAKKVFVPTGFSAINNQAYVGYFDKMKTWLSYYDQIVFLSADYQDINFAKAHGIDKIRIIPNGASAAEFLAKPQFDLRKKLRIDSDTKIILHVGSYTTMKGHDEAMGIFLRAKLPKSALVFVGTNFNSPVALWFVTRLHWFKGLGYKNFYQPKAIKQLLRFIKTRLNKGSKQVHLTALTREELVAAYQQADVFLFPSLIECSPVVLFEAMASKTPFLSTNVGNAAEIISWSGSGLLLPTIKDEAGLGRAVLDASANMLQTLVTDENRINQLAESGYEAWLANFTWEKIAGNYEKLYNSL
jgi:glycosyltransferase involved in cell wall biosynthesis